MRPKRSNWRVIRPLEFLAAEVATTPLPNRPSSPPSITMDRMIQPTRSTTHPRRWKAKCSLCQGYVKAVLLGWGHLARLTSSNSLDDRSVHGG
jgi:hypothetical protein